MDPQGTPRLLIVDDDRKLAGLIREYLTPMGYDVELRHNGPDGLAAALASPYHAVILDGHSEAKSRGIYIPVSEIQEIHFICSHHYEIILQKIA